MWSVNLCCHLLYESSEVYPLSVLDMKYPRLGRVLSEVSCFRHGIDEDFYLWTCNVRKMLCSGLWGLVVRCKFTGVSEVLLYFDYCLLYFSILTIVSYTSLFWLLSYTSLFFYCLLYFSILTIVSYTSLFWLLSYTSLFWLLSLILLYFDCCLLYFSILTIVSYTSLFWLLSLILLYFHYYLLYFSILTIISYTSLLWLLSFTGVTSLNNLRTSDVSSRV
jgi:hypothetical protein